MTKAEKLQDLVGKVEYEGGWLEMIHYGSPPHIDEFPELKKDFEKLKKMQHILDDLEQTIAELCEEHDVEYFDL